MSFILDALRKLEEKRAPETTRELLAAGLPGPQGTPRGKPLRTYILSAALAVSILAAAGWLALKYRAGGSEGEPRAVPSSPIAGEEDGTTPPGLSTAGGRTGRKAGTATAEPRPLRDGPGTFSPAADPDSLPTEKPSPPGAIENAPLPAESDDRFVEPLTADSAAIDEPPSPEHPAASPLLPLDELPEAVRGSLEDLKIEGHVYSDDPEYRLLSIDGTLKREGDTVRPGLLIEAISPEGAIFTYRGYRFSMKGY